MPRLAIIPNFVCEACTVRSVIRHELCYMSDINLLCLERMSLLDRLWYLAKNTRNLYQQKRKQIQHFEGRYQI